MSDSWSNALVLVLGGSCLCICWIALELVIRFTAPSEEAHDLENGRGTNLGAKVLTGILEGPACEPPLETLCSICLDGSTGPGEEWRALRCGHQYHLDCISNWLQKRLCCPVCRDNLCSPKATILGHGLILAQRALEGSSVIASASTSPGATSSSSNADDDGEPRADDDDDDDDVQLELEMSTIANQSMLRRFEAVELSCLPGAVPCPSEFTSVVAIQPGMSSGSAMT